MHTAFPALGAHQPHREQSLTHPRAGLSWAEQQVMPCPSSLGLTDQQPTRCCRFPPVFPTDCRPGLCVASYLVFRFCGHGGDMTAPNCPHSSQGAGASPQVGAAGPLPVGACFGAGAALQGCPGPTRTAARRCSVTRARAVGTCLLLCRGHPACGCWGRAVWAGAGGGLSACTALSRFLSCLFFSCKFSLQFSNIFYYFSSGTTLFLLLLHILRVKILGP